MSPRPEPYTDVTDAKPLTAFSTPEEFERHLARCIALVRSDRSPRQERTDNLGKSETRHTPFLLKGLLDINLFDRGFGHHLPAFWASSDVNHSYFPSGGALKPAGQSSAWRRTRRIASLAGTQVYLLVGLWMRQSR